MSTFALVHGGGGSAWDWHLVEPELRERGHEAVAVDLPSEDASAGWSDYADTVVEAIGDRTGVVVVGHSLGGFTAPLVADRVPVDLVVFLAGMVPSPGELFADWWTNAGYESSGEDDVFYHDVPPKLAAEAQSHEREEASAALKEPWPLPAFPDVPDEIPPLPRRPPVSGDVGTPPCARAAWGRGGRDRRRPLRHAQPSSGAGRPLGRLRLSPRDGAVNRTISLALPPCRKRTGGGIVDA